MTFCPLAEVSGNLRRTGPIDLNTNLFSPLQSRGICPFAVEEVIFVGEEESSFACINRENALEVILFRKFGRRHTPRRFAAAVEKYSGDIPECFYKIVEENDTLYYLAA